MHKCLEILINCTDEAAFGDEKILSVREVADGSIYVAMLLYKKQVISSLKDLKRSFQFLEIQETTQLPIFISAVETHIIL